MSNWGEGAVNNDIGWGQGQINNDIDWGSIYSFSYFGQTNIIGTVVFTIVFDQTFN
jgi:hypothetical protein